MDASAIKAQSKTLCQTNERPGGGTTETCCFWKTDSETETTTEYCTECTTTKEGDELPCTHTQTDVSSVAPPTPSPVGPRGPLGSILPGGGVLQELQQTPPLTRQPGGIAPEVAPLTGGSGEEPTDNDGVAERTRHDELCPEGQLWDLSTARCLPECELGQEGQAPGITCTYGSGKETEPPIPPTKRPPTGLLGETAPQVAPPPTTAEDGSQQPPTEPLCQEGYERDEETGLCVPIESPQDTEQQEQEQDEPEQEEAQEEPSTDEGEDNEN